jgi:hypothetical protein
MNMVSCRSFKDVAPVVGTETHICEISGSRHVKNGLWMFMAINATIGIIKKWL